MTMLPLPNINETSDLVAEFLAKGGSITKCPPGERTEDITYTSGFYGRKKKEPATDIEEESD